MDLRFKSIKFTSGDPNKTELIGMGAVKAALPHLSSTDAATRRSSVMLVNSLAQMGINYVFIDKIPLSNRVLDAYCRLKQSYSSNSTA